MKTRSISPIRLRLRHYAFDLLEDCRGVAATEFAVIVPVMLVMFFGTLELSSGVAVDRKITLVASTLSDLTSQTLGSVANGDLENVFAASASILTPYSVTPVEPTISEIYVDDAKIAKIQWSKSATIVMEAGAPKATLQDSKLHKPKDIVALPPGLAIPKTYLIWSEVDYKYTPTVGFLIKAGIPLHDEAYTRPRQSTCVDYPAPVAPAVPCTPLP